MNAFERRQMGLFWFYFPSCVAKREIDIKITLERAQKQFVTRVHTLFILHTQHNVSINDDNSDDLCTSSPCLTHSNSFCWWRHNRLPMTSQWPDNCGAITWIMISNSLDIDFTWGDIHDRSCKKDQYLTWRKNSQVSVILKVMNSAQSDRMIAINLTPPMLVSEIYNVHFIW